MENIFWYVGLAIIGLGTSAYTIYTKRYTFKVSTLLVFYLYVAGFTWICEFLVLGLFNSYSYKTGLFSDVWAQNLLGHLILNASLYPAASIVMVTNRRKYVCLAFFATFFTLFEFVFTKLRLYEDHWWKYYMTFITVIILMSITHTWFEKMKHGSYGLTRVVIFYFVAMIIIHTPAPVLLLLGKQYYQLSLINILFGNLYRSSIMIIFLYHLLESFIMVLFTCILKKWYWSMIPPIISFAAQITFSKMGILIVEGSWKLVYTLYLYEIFIVSFIMIEKYTLKLDSNLLRKK